ncbi:MAG: site-specific DNA-methyltransferase [Spirochaetota bacterium]|nr:site-specific DNA-methyltransferase [Spirochaetota bacterium]
MNEKSSRNKTIIITEEDRLSLEKNILREDGEFSIKNITNKIILGDILAIISKLPKNFIDLLIIDPPYNLSKNYHGNKFQERSEQEYLEYLDSWFVQLIPCLKSTASIYVCCDWKSSQAIYMTMSKYLIIQNRITWQREKGRGAKQNWKNGMEDIWFATFSKKYYFNIDAVKIKRKVIAPYKKDGVPKDWKETKDGNFRLTYPSNFWDDISIPYWSMPENTEHPTQKPEKLIAKLILASSEEGNFVFDPFLGSGTTAVVAKKLNRIYSGIEQNMEYCLLSEKRLNRVETDKSIQGYTGVFWERNTKPVKEKNNIE